MVIKVNMVGKEAIMQLLDIALKTGGISNLQATQNILASLEIITEKNKTN